MVMRKILDRIRHLILSQPYHSSVSNIGFKAIGKSSELRTLPLTEGRVYIPMGYTFNPQEGYYTDFMVMVEGSSVIRIANSDIGTLFKVVPYVRERLMTDETLL